MKLSGHRGILVSNFLSLSGIQVVNYFLPLITVPYLTRVLGPERFGLIAFSQSFIQYFVLLINYGFDLSVPREISINRENKEKISEIFSSIMLLKMIFIFISFLLLSSFVFSMGKFRKEWLIYFLTFCGVVANVFFPMWFFQGMEHMRPMSILAIVSKVIFTISIFIFIRSQNDYVYVPLLYAFGSIIVGLMSLWIIFEKFDVRLKFPSIKKLKDELKEGWYLFISSIAINLYTVSNTFILGLFTNNTIVGYYSGGEKIIKAVQGLLGPVTQTIYPYMSKLASESRGAALSFLRKIIKMIGLSSFLISLALFIFAPLISDVILGAKFKESIPIIRILSFLPFIIGLSNLFAQQGLYTFGLYSIVSRFVYISAMLHLILVLFLTYLYSYIGTAVSSLMTEIGVTFFAIHYFRAKILNTDLKSWLWNVEVKGLK